MIYAIEIDGRVELHNVKETASIPENGIVEGAASFYGTNPALLKILDGQIMLKTAQELEAESVAAEQARAAAETARLVAVWSPEMLQKLGLFRLTLQRHFGVGAETNQDISQSGVAAYFIGKRQLQILTLEELADSMILSTLYAELAPLCPDGTTWTAPYERITQ